MIETYMILFIMFFVMSLVLSYFAGSLKISTILLMFAMISAIGTITGVVDISGYAIAIISCAFGCFLEFRQKNE